MKKNEQYVFDPLALDECQTFMRDAPLPPSVTVQKVPWVKRVHDHWGWKLLPPITFAVLCYIYSLVLQSKALDFASMLEITFPVVGLVIFSFVYGART